MPGSARSTPIDPAPRPARSPSTPGHVQLEASFAQYVHDRPTGSGGAGEQLSVAPTEFRVGLTEHTEVDLTLTPFLSQRLPGIAPVARSGPTVGTAAAADHASGFGDLQLQGKLNLLGDNGGPVAFGTVCYLTLPTAAASRGLGTGRVQGGVIVPVQVSLPAGFVLAGQVEVDFPRNDADTATGLDVLQTAELSHPIVGQLSVFGEYVGVAPVHLGHGPRTSADAGLTCQVGRNMQLDVAVDLGVSRDTPQYSVLAGIAVRR